MNKVFVYGTLLSGEPNNRLLQNDESKLLGKDTILEFNMHDMGSFPALVETDLYDLVFGEVWEISDEVFKRLDMLEGYPRFYNRKEIEGEFGMAWVYYNNNAVDYPIIESGDWKLHLGKEQK